MNVRRAMLVDLYVEDDRSVVMVDERVLGLSPLATTVLEAVPDGTSASVSALTELVVATFGPPEEPGSAEEIVRQQVWDLAAHHIVVIAQDVTPEHGRAITGAEDVPQE